MWKRRKEPAAVTELAGKAARRLNEDLLAPASSRVLDTLPQVAQTVRQELAPRVTHAVETVGDVAATGQRQLAEVARRARAEGGEVLGEVAGSVSHLPPLRRRRRATRRGAAFGMAVASGLATNAGHRVQQATGKAAKRAGSITADTVGVLCWLVAAAALLLFGYLSAEQRARVVAFAKTAWAQARELYRDFQGYDEAM
jgi:hypothetical protein